MNKCRCANKYLMQNENVILYWETYGVLTVSYIFWPGLAIMVFKSGAN